MSDAPLILYHGAHRFTGPLRLMPAGKRHSEHGSGLYLTTSPETARKYAKGGGVVLTFTLDGDLTWLNDTDIPLAAIKSFLDGRPRLRNRPQIWKDLVANAERMAARSLGPANAVRGYVLENLMVNHGALTGEHGPALAEFFVAQGIDASHILQSNEDWVLLYNLDKVRSWKASSSDLEARPRISRSR